MTKFVDVDGTNIAETMEAVLYSDVEEWLAIAKELI